MNSIGTLHLKDNNFQPQLAEDSELLIKVSPSRLSYAVINADKQLCILYDTVLQAPLVEILDELVTEADYLKFRYKNVKIAIETFNFTFIPIELYSENDLTVYQSLFSSTRHSKTFVSTIRKSELNTVFTVSDSLIEPLLELFPNARIHSQAEALINGVLHNYQGEKKLILQFNQSSFELLILSNSTLQFYNIFSIGTPDDFNYYLLFTLQQLNLLESDLEVVLCGDIDKESLLFKRVEKYFSRISYGSNVRMNLFTGDFSRVAPHQYFSLLSLYLCE